MKLIAAAVILGLCLIVAAFISGGRYEGVAVSRGDDNGYVIVIDRFTGAKAACVGQRCGPVENSN